MPSALVSLPGVGDALARRLVDGEFGGRALRSKADLRRLSRDDPRAFRRLPAVTRAHVLFDVSRSLPTSTARTIAGDLSRHLRLGGRRPGAIHVVGSLRHARATRAKDIDLLVVSATSDPVIALLPRSRAGIVASFAAGPRRRGLIVRWGRSLFCQVDLFLAKPGEQAYALFHYGSPRDYIIRIRALAKRRGWLLNQYGLFSRASGRPVAGSVGLRSEAAIARLLGVSIRTPDAR